MEEEGASFFQKDFKDFKDFKDLKDFKDFKDFRNHQVLAVFEVIPEGL